MRDWLRVLRFVKDSLFEDRLVVVAPGVAFFMMMGLMPTLAALILVYGLVADPVQIHHHFEQIRPAIPAQAAELLGAQIERTVAQRRAAGWGLAISLGIMLWAGSYAMGVIAAALNIAFKVRETRGVVKLTLLRLLLTTGAVALGLLAMGVLVVVPLLQQLLALPEPLNRVLSLSRWPLLLLLGMAGLSILYQLAPNRPVPRFRLVTRGAALAATLWVIASSLFSLYVGRIDVYQDFLGAFGAVVIMMLWMLISAFVILLGAELDAALERELWS